MIAAPYEIAGPDAYPDAETLLAEARNETGLDDFGPGDFRAGLDVLLESLRRDANLPQSGADAALRIIRRRLANRLKVEAWISRHTEIETAIIDGPVSILGLPRTGTTAFGNMMSLDGQFRSLRLWEQAAPVPPPILNEEVNDPRRVATAKDLVGVAEEHKAMHIFEVDATTEDTEVLGLQFRAQQMTLPIYSYHNWWRDADMRQTFAYHRRIAQLLQSRRPPNRWLFKAPHHKFHMEDFLSAYPDAKFIMTHRDPAKVVPSYASLVSSLFPPEWKEHNDMARFGRHISDHLRIGMERAIEARKRIGEDRFFDVHHHEFAADPYGVLQKTYDFLGLEIRPQVRADWERWQAVNHVGAHGKHRYKAEDFGLSADQIRADYAFYIRHFDIPTS